MRSAHFDAIAIGFLGHFSARSVCRDVTGHCLLGFSAWLRFGRVDCFQDEILLLDLSRNTQADSNEQLFGIKAQERGHRICLGRLVGREGEFFRTHGKIAEFGFTQHKSNLDYFFALVGQPQPERDGRHGTFADRRTATSLAFARAFSARTAADEAPAHAAASVMTTTRMPAAHTITTASRSTAPTETTTEVCFDEEFSFEERIFG